MNRDLWNSLSNFQTHDLVQRAFLRKHNRELNAEQTWAITSCFIQAEEYFRNAHDAAETVRPLMLYYGVLSLSRGMILFLNWSKKEESLKFSHGLKQKDWKNTLSQEASNILDLEVIIEDGAFSDLVAVITPLQTSMLPMVDGGVIFDPVGTQNGLQVGDSLKLDDILSRIPNLASPYRDVTDTREKMRPGVVLYTEMANIVRVVHDAVIGATTEDEVRNLFGVPKDIAVGLLPPGVGCELPNFTYRLERSATGDYPASCPIFESTGNLEIGQLIGPWPNGRYVSPISKCYLTAYILGMLVRYFPSRWMSVVRGRKGDAALPLLRAAIEHVESDFPKMALDLLN